MTADIAIKGKRSRTLDEALDDIAKDNVWDGTRAILQAIAYESKHLHAWRPVRAAAVAALRDIAATQEGNIMSGPEFQTWRTTAMAVAQARQDGYYLDRIGISQFQARQYGKSGAPKIIALACAHYLLGLPLPIPPGDHRVFNDWYTPRFGAVERVAEWLGVTAPWLRGRQNGFERLKGVDVKREPEVSLIRALDWMHNVGPFCPYGQKGPLEIWPGQDLGEDYE